MTEIYFAIDVQYFTLCTRLTSCCGWCLTIVPISFRVASLALEKLNDCLRYLSSYRRHCMFHSCLIRNIMGAKQWMEINTKKTLERVYKQFFKTRHIFFLTRHNAVINDDQRENLHTSTPCLTRSVCVLAMTSQSISNLLAVDTFHG